MICYYNMYVIISIIIFFLLIILLYKYMTNKDYNVVVFDMDETLGHFEEFSVLVYSIEEYFKKKITQKEFNNLLDLFPELLRPNILNILYYIISKKKEKTCQKVIIYTNNQHKDWAKKIKNYFNYKLDYNLFDQLIAGYKLNNVKVEMKRTTYLKTKNDLFNCANLPANAKICFIDDIYHEHMNNKSIYYILVNPYSICLSTNIICKRLQMLNLSFNDNDFKEYLNKNIKDCSFTKKKTIEQYKKDIIIGKELLLDIQNFFN